MKFHSFFVAATGQNVGKTTTCLGLVSGLAKRHSSVGYMKPVGQEHVELETGQRVDKDVLLFRSYFNLQDPPELMSPVLFPRSFTRDYLDGKVSHQQLVDQIDRSHRTIAAQHSITVLEGTGHTAVGSIVNLNNAQVAARLKTPVVLIAPGGLGSSFDELELNRAQCQLHGAAIAGIILNRVLPEKRDMIVEYMEKALSRWNLPLLGCIPYDPLLSTPNMNDFEQLFQTTIIAGEEHRYRHFENIRLVASPVEVYRSLDPSNHLLITPAVREDVILSTLSRYWDLKISHPQEELQTGIILTGKLPPKDSLLDQLRKANVPTLYVPVSSFVAMKMINTYTAKIRFEDVAKIEEAVRVVESHINFDLLEQAVSIYY